MSFIELAKRRYSCRKYQNKEVEKEKISQVLEAARIAPSAKNIQPWHFVVIHEEENLKRIKGCYKGRWIKTAPYIIVDHLTLAATDIGLATCWICKFDVMKCSEILELPEGIEPIAMIPIGYPADKVDVNRHRNDRDNIANIVHKEKFYYKYFKK